MFGRPCFAARAEDAKAADVMSLIPWKAAAVLGLIIACEVMLGVKLDHQSSALPCARHSPRHRTAPHRTAPARRWRRRTGGASPDAKPNRSPNS